MFKSYNFCNINPMFYFEITVQFVKPKLNMINHDHWLVCNITVIQNVFSSLTSFFLGELWLSVSSFRLLLTFLYIFFHPGGLYDIPLL